MVKRKNTYNTRKDLPFKNKWEAKVWSWLPKKKTVYEPRKIRYQLERNYIPDFLVTREDGSELFIEAKGYLRPEDRSKMIAVKEENPELDIRFVFAYDNKINKNSNTRYSDWAEKNGYKYCIGKIPQCWIYPNKYDTIYSSEYYQKNKESLKEKNRWNKIKRFYGLSKEDYDKLASEQNNQCAICKTDFASLPRNPDIDHIHGVSPIKVRGLLCWKCNGGLGQYNDNPALFRAAADYLEKF